jgi:hypothetical protein
MHNFFRNVTHILLRDLAPLVGSVIIDLPALNPRDGTSRRSVARIMISNIGRVSTIAMNYCFRVSNVLASLE